MYNTYKMLLNEFLSHQFRLEQPGKVKKWKSAWNIFLRITYAAFMTV